MDKEVADKLRRWIIFGLGVVLLAPAAFLLGNGLRMKSNGTLLSAGGAVALFFVGKALINWTFRRRQRIRES
jgi:hypothetical protein